VHELVELPDAGLEQVTETEPPAQPVDRTRGKSRAAESVDDAR
jgi:hypothetical protein